MKQQSLLRRIRHSPFHNPRKGADRTIRNAGAFDRAYFDDDNYCYTEWHRDQAQLIAKRILAALHPKKDWVLFDVGCALGGIVETFRRQGYEAYGVDLSRWCIQSSRVSRYLRFGSATNLPCADQSVDVAMCFDMFQYLTRSEAKSAAKELRRITRRYLCIECITREDTDWSNAEENPDAERKNRSLFTEKQYIALFEQAGFRLKKKSFLPREIDGKKIFGEHYKFYFSFNAIFEVG